MRIYSGNVGVELSLQEFSELIIDEEKIDDLLNLIYDLEMEKAMQYDDDQMNEFQQQLYEEIEMMKEREQADNDQEKMKRILNHLERYGI